MGSWLEFKLFLKSFLENDKEIHEKMTLQNENKRKKREVLSLTFAALLI